MTTDSNRDLNFFTFLIKILKGNVTKLGLQEEEQLNKKSNPFNNQCSKDCTSKICQVKKTTFLFKLTHKIQSTFLLQNWVKLSPITEKKSFCPGLKMDLFKEKISFYLCKSLV